MEQLFLNKETGEVLNRAAMLNQFVDEYDGDDPTNVVGLWEIYEPVE